MSSTIGGHVARNQRVFSALIPGEAEHLRWQEEKNQLIETTLRSLDVKGTLADVGCFTGAATERFRDTGFARAVGIDANEDMFPRLRARGIEPRRWLGGTEACPAKDGEFDFLIAADVIEHVVDSDSFVEELRRVVRKGGTLIITTPNQAFWLSRLRLLAGKPPWSSAGASPTVKADSQIDLNHIRITTRQEWEALFRARGLDVLSVEGWSILNAITGGARIRVRHAIDRWMTRFPDYAFGLMFVLRNRA